MKAPRFEIHSEFAPSVHGVMAPTTKMRNQPPAPAADVVGVPIV